MKQYQQLLEKVKDCKAGTIPASWNPELKLPFVIPAMIDFSRMVDVRFIRRSRRFSCVDVLEKEGPHKHRKENWSIVCTVVDEKKGTVFGITATPTNIVISPQHRTNPESFVDFYLMVRRNIPEGVTAKFGRYPNCL